MSPRRAGLYAILISLVLHMAVLSMPLPLDTRGPSEAKAGIVTVSLRSNTDAPAPTPESKPGEKGSPPEKARREKGREREATVSLGSRDAKYRDYLLQVKRRIESRWVYPGTAFERGERGVTTVRFTIGADGTLEASIIIDSSGYQLLDECAVGVVRAAAPFDVLPQKDRLDRLHIIAAFHYQLASGR